METNKISEKGKNFNDEKLNESNLSSNIKVIYNDKIYITGNRRNTDVELYIDSTFKKIVDMSKIQLIK
jgi:hypothetical protein